MRTYQVFTARCRKCGGTFEFLDEGQSYDMRMLRSKNSNIHGRVMCNSDAAFKEVWEILKLLLGKARLTEFEISERFNEVFGAICDPAPDGSQFDMTGRPFCPACGASDISYGPTEPPVFRNANLPLVSHHGWDRMSEEEKRIRVESLLLGK